MHTHHTLASEVVQARTLEFSRAGEVFRKKGTILGMKITACKNIKKLCSIFDIKSSLFGRGVGNEIIV